MIRRNYWRQRIDRGRSADSESGRYKTRAFITQGKLHFLMFTINNLNEMEKRFQMDQILFEESQDMIEPFEAFREGRKVLCVFLETNSTSLNFQVLDQSNNTSPETSMEATVLRCFRDMIGVIYKIGEARTVVVYQIYQEEYGEVQSTFEERNFVPEYNLRSRGRRRTRFRLRKITEVENWVVAGSTLHDIFFLKRDSLCLMIGSGLVLWRITGLDRENIQADGGYKSNYIQVPIRGYDDKKFGARRFRLDRREQMLYYFHGKKIWKSYLLKQFTIKYGEEMMTAGTINLKELYGLLRELNSERKPGEAPGEVEQMLAPTIGLTDTLLKRERPSDMASSFSDQAR